MKKEKVKVSQELNDSIQTIQVEMDGLKQLIAYMMATTEYIIPEERVALLQKDFMEKNKIYNSLKTKVEDLIPVGFNKEKTSWNLDFATTTVEFVEND